jgi:hypothetical protein
MPLRHGTHHGLSFILSIGLSVVLTELIRSVMPSALKVFDNTSRALINTFKLRVDLKIVSMLLLALIIAVVYGIVVGIRERRPDRR